MNIDEFRVMLVAMIGSGSDSFRDWAGRAMCSAYEDGHIDEDVLDEIDVFEKRFKLDSPEAAGDGRG